MDSGRKRIHLGALSPSSARSGQRRRCSENEHSCPDAVENVDPNTTSGTGTTTFGCRDGFLTPSQRRLHGVDLSKASTPAPVIIH
ncbi:uncharacterized protein LOC108211099 isoform X3 [Daucus carota subsp. sativus]|uniref:uncharacterized protein LOC108211099 isoform X3 n=1 Tax=Daucus carota subsp. sativus TaxID=79200 RepID=UPI003082B1DB